MQNELRQNIASRLIKARQQKLQWDAGGGPFPQAVDDAYAIQDIVTQELGAKITGWKTSAPDLVSIPIAAPVYSQVMFKSGAKIPSSQLFVIGIEGEIAFRIAHDLPLAPNPYQREDLLEAVGELMPVIEVVDTRMANGLAQNKKLVLADNQSNGGLVIGAAISNWHELDFTNLKALVTVNGAIEYCGFDGNRAGDLFKLLAWAANHCANRGLPFKAGDIITTGTYTGLLFVEPGSHVVVDFPAIGQVEVSFPI
jgi:2-keto-4-pentenoate hydratase